MCSPESDVPDKPEESRDSDPENRQRESRALVAIERWERVLHIGADDASELKPQLDRVAVADLGHVLVAKIWQHRVHEDDEDRP